MSATLHGRRRYLFMLGHMRGYTSVLAHILGSNPCIRGYREHHIAYDSVSALKRLGRRLDAELPHSGRDDEFLLDKLLHDSLRLAPFVLASRNVRLLFVLRAPDDTLRSLLALFPQFGEEWALAYYIARLRTLIAHAGSPVLDPARTLFIDAESLLDDTAATFARLEHWLGLAEPLSRDYRVSRHTGERGHGDCSPRLRDGRLRDERLSQPVALSARAQAEATRAYQHCRSILHPLHGD